MPRPDRTFRTPALIIRRRVFNEADRLLTILTPHHGKLDVIAKGARKLTSTKTGHVELFTRAEMLIHRGRDFGIATQVEMQAPYLPLREDLARGADATYAAELTDRFITPGDDDLQAVFALLDATFGRLCGSGDPRLALRFFEMKLLNQVGFRPELSECVMSHQALLPEDQYFSFVEGGVVSRASAVSNVRLVPLALPTLKILRHLQRSDYAQVDSLHLTPAQHDDVERILLGYLENLLERRLQSVEFVRRLRLRRNLTG